MPLPVGSMKGVAPGFEPLPAGIYDVEIVAVEVRQSGEEAKHPGSDYLAVEMNVLDEEYEGRKLWTNVSMHDNARGLLKAFLLACEYSEEEMEADDFSIEEDDLEGKRFSVAVKVGKNPKTKEANNSVKRFLLPEEGESELPS